MGSYEVRSLTYLWNHEPEKVLWLKSSPGGTDLIYPAFDYPSEYQDLGVQKGVLYTWPAFLVHLKAAYKLPNPLPRPTATSGPFNRINFGGAR